MCKRGGDCTANTKAAADDGAKTTGAKGPAANKPAANQPDPKAVSGNSDSLPYGDAAQYMSSTGDVSTTPGDPAPAAAGGRGGAAGSRGGSALKGLGSIHW